MTDFESEPREFFDSQNPRDTPTRKAEWFVTAAVATGHNPVLGNYVPVIGALVGVGPDEAFDALDRLRATGDIIIDFATEDIRLGAGALPLEKQAADLGQIIAWGFESRQGFDDGYDPEGI